MPLVVVNVRDSRPSLTTAAIRTTLVKGEVAHNEFHACEYADSEIDSVLLPEPDLVQPGLD